MTEKKTEELEENALFDKWVDEYFSNSSVDLDILRKAFNSIRNM